MTSRATRSIAPPGWGAAGERGEERALRPAPGSRSAVRGRRRGPEGTDLAGAALVLGGTLGLWAAFLGAVW
jgi:hypothetical protein